MMHLSHTGKGNMFYIQDFSRAFMIDFSSSVISLCVMYPGTIVQSCRKQSSMEPLATASTFSSSLLFFFLPFTSFTLSLFTSSSRSSLLSRSKLSRLY